MAEFAPKQYKAENISLYIRKDKLEKVEKAAAEYKVSRSEFINQCIDFAMEHMKKDDE